MCDRTLLGGSMSPDYVEILVDQSEQTAISFRGRLNGLTYQQNPPKLQKHTLEDREGSKKGFWVGLLNFPDIPRRLVSLMSGLINICLLA